MKRVLMVLLVIGIVAAAALGPVWGQDKKVTFSLNAGVQTNIFQGSSFDKAWFTLDARAGISLGRAFVLSPEVMGLFNYGFDDDASTFVLFPGLLANCRIGKFFVGAGAVLPIGFFEGETDTADIAPKINIGYASGHLQMTAYFIIWTDLDFLDYNTAGINIGYRF